MLSFTYGDILTNLLLASRWTIALSLVAFVGGGLLGLVVLLARVSAFASLRWAARVHIELFQGTPLLMQLFLIFFGLSLLGLEVSAWTAAALALTLFTSAFLAEIWRGCVEAIPKGQWEAANSLGMGFLQQMRWVVLPQALKMAIPPTVGFSVQVVKGTAVTSIIGFVELTKAGTILTNATFRPFAVFGTVAVLYFVLCFPLSAFAKYLEKTKNPERNRHAAR